MNYELLLKKYMDHVRQSEGTDFTDRLNENLLSDVNFSEEEADYLKAVSEE